MITDEAGNQRPETEEEATRLAIMQGGCRFVSALEREEAERKRLVFQSKREEKFTPEQKKRLEERRQRVLEAKRKLEEVKRASKSKCRPYFLYFRGLPAFTF